MFNMDTCKKCGICLSKCPYMEMSIEKAKEVITIAIETKESPEISKICIGCSYCNTICPTESNPADLRKEILQKQKQKRGPGVSAFGLICEDVPANMFTVALEYETEEKKKNLQKYMNPPKGETFFYLGCSLSYLYTDLAQTKLLEDFPCIGGMKYCCGGYVERSFGEDETKIKGKQLLERFNEIGVQKLITFCPGCDRMLQQVHPHLVEGFDIEVQHITDYLLEKYNKGDIEFPHKLNQKITFQDACGWRNVDSKIYEGPRQLLEAMGAEVVEMVHNKRQSICCGLPFLGKNPTLAKKATEKRVAEAKEAGAEIIAVSCTGCLGLNPMAVEDGLDVYNITELAQIAIGEKPPHRVGNVLTRLQQDTLKKINEDPALFKTKYTIKNGEVMKV